jgi:hypothetical protein
LNNVYLLLKTIYHFALKINHETYLIVLYIKKIPRSKIQMVHVIHIHHLNSFLLGWKNGKKWEDINLLLKLDSFNT